MALTGFVTTRRTLPGAAVAGLTALISGVSVFVNSYGVHAYRQATVYTTAKNLVAAAVLAVGALVAGAVRPRTRGATPGPGPTGAARWAGLVYVGAVGGGAAFVLFFEGLARTSAVPAAFLRDTLVVWVALLALPVLGERLSRWNLAAIGLLVAGQSVAAGGLGHLVAGRGEALVLGATVLWAVEVVVAKRLLTGMSPGEMAVTRMAGGSAVLVTYLFVTGRAHLLLGLSGGQAAWALVTGLLLAAYVATWMVALARGRAVDVTSVLVGSAIVTAMLGAVAGQRTLAPQAAGLIMVALGTVLVVRGWPRMAAAT